MQSFYSSIIGTMAAVIDPGERVNEVHIEGLVSVWKVVVLATNLFLVHKCSKNINVLHNRN